MGRGVSDMTRLLFTITLFESGGTEIERGVSEVDPDGRVTIAD